MFIVYLAFSKFRKKSAVSLSQQLKSAWWLLAYYVMMLVICYFGSFGEGRGVLSAPLDLIIIAIGSLAIYFWAMYSGLPKAMIEEEDEAFDHQDVTLPLQEESSSTTLS
jgi:hypothetical protein